MGIEELLQRVKKENKGGIKKPLFEYKGKIIGVDISIYLNKAVHSKKYGSEIARLSTIGFDYAHYIRSYLNEFFLRFLDLGIKLVFVFDGCRNPLKFNTNTNRGQLSKKAKEMMNNYWSSTEIFNNSNFYKVAKGTVTVTDEVYQIAYQWATTAGIRCICAPLESDWQLVSMELTHKIDTILSTDSDILVCGAKCIITDIDEKYQCTVLTEQHLLNCLHKSLHVQHISRKDVLYFISLLKNDYNEKSLSWKKAVETFSRNKTRDPTMQFIYPTVFQITSDDYWNESTTAVSLKSFDTINNTFLEPVDVGYNPMHVLFENIPQVTELIKLFNLQLWSRNGKNMQYDKSACAQEIDWTKYPIEKHATETLISWLYSRGKPTKANTNRDLLIKCIKYMVRTGNDQHIVQIFSSGNWVTSDIIVSASTEWDNNQETLRKTIIRLQTVTEIFIRENFGIRNGVRTRALNWFLGGHLNITKLQCRPCKLYDNSEGYMISCAITPSMRCDEYQVVLVYMKSGDEYKFVPSPLGTRCPCPAGSFFCAHALALLLFLCAVQTLCKEENTMSQVLQKMPPQIQSIQNLPIPFHMVYGTGKLGATRVEKYLKNFVSIPKKGTTATWSQKHIENDELKELDEITADEICQENPIDIITAALKLFNYDNKTSKKRDISSLQKEQIEIYNTNIIPLRGPNANWKNKLQQLERHQRLHERFKKKELHNNQLSYYLHEMEADRLKMIQAIKDKDVVFFENGKIPKSLNNIPSGWVILADRGFAFDGVKYPNFNRIITPHFLSKRQQFSREELINDLTSCKLRYTSETHFSRVTDESSIAGIVSFDYFSIMQYIIDWANGAANLCQPFYPPDGYEDSRPVTKKKAQK